MCLLSRAGRRHVALCSRCGARALGSCDRRNGSARSCSPSHRHGSRGVGPSLEPPRPWSRLCRRSRPNQGTTQIRFRACQTAPNCWVSTSRRDEPVGHYCPKTKHNGRATLHRCRSCTALPRRRGKRIPTPLLWEAGSQAAPRNPTASPASRSRLHSPAGIPQRVAPTEASSSPHRQFRPDHSTIGKTPMPQTTSPPRPDHCRVSGCNPQC